MKKNLDKKVLITGGCGFIGSHLAEYLLQKDYEVTVFDRYNINNDKGWLENSKFKNEIKFILGDIRDFDSILNSIKGHDIVIHLAALIGIPYSYISPLAYIKTNIEGTYNVLEACRINNIGKIINTSTSEVYGSAIYTPIDELHPIQPQSPYSASKISADCLSKSYYCSFNSPIKTIRPFNTYGPRQSKRAIIPTIISQLLNKNDFINVGSLEPMRDFTFVHDTCEAYLKMINSKLGGGEAFNVGNNKSISVNELINLLFDISGVEKRIIVENNRIRPKNSEVSKLKCNFQKFNELTSWEPNYTLRNGLELTFEWFQKNNKSEDHEYQI